MAVPDRFRPPPISPAAIEELSPLCDAIEDGVYRNDDIIELLAKWRERTKRDVDPAEFTTYYKSIAKEEFIAHALLPVPELVSDLAYAELKSVLEAIIKGEVESEALEGYYLEWLEANLPESNIMDLIFWPNSWFHDDSLFLNDAGHFRPEAEMTADQILRYAMLKSGRVLPDAPDDVTLLYAMPGG